MSEQIHYKKTAEEGWSKMQSLLDREMPVERRSRRYLFFWFMIAAVAFVGMGAIYTFQQDAKDTQRILNHPATPVTPTKLKVPTPPAPTEKSSDVQEEFAMNSTTEHSQTTNATVHTSASNKSNIIQPGSSLTKETKAVIIPNEIEQMATTTLAVNNAEVAIAENVVASTVENITQPIVTSETETSSFVPVVIASEPIPALDIAYLNIPLQDEIIVDLGEINETTSFPGSLTTAENRKVSFSPNLEANTITGFHGGAGVFAAGGIDANVNGALAINASVGYRSFNPGVNLFSSSRKDLAGELNNNSILKTDATYDGSTIYVASESISSASYNDLNPVIDYIHQWQVNAGMTCNINRHFYVNGGLALNFGTKGYSEYPIVVPDYSSANAVPQVTHLLNDFNVIRKTTTSLYAGIGYRIGKHFAIKAEWLHTSQPYLITDNNNNAFVSFKQRDDFIRGINVGMKYTL